MRYILLFFAFVMFSCSTDVEPHEETLDSPLPIETYLRAALELGNYQVSNGVINLGIAKYFDTPSSQLRIRAAFADPQSGELITGDNVSITSVGNIQESNGLYDFNEFYIGVEEEMPVSGTYTLQYQSNNNVFSSVNISNTVDFDFDVTSSLTRGEIYFEVGMNENVDLSWSAPMNQTDEMYLMVCGDDARCHFQNINNGNASVSFSPSVLNNTFSGQELYVFVVKGKQVCVDSNNEEICFNSFTYTIPKDRVFVR